MTAGTFHHHLYTIPFINWRSEISLNMQFSPVSKTKQNEKPQKQLFGIG